MAVVLIFLSLILVWASAEECVLRGTPSPAQVVTTGKNPYGMIVVPKSYGQFNKNDLLVSNWNDPSNQFFGQGNTIVVIRNHAAIRTITINKAHIGVCGHDKVDNTGLGFTMAMAWLGRGTFLQCSTPINKRNSATNSDGIQFPAHPGCCLVINDKGEVLATYRKNGINAPWGATSLFPEDEEEGAVTLFLASVLGPKGNANGINNGQITRYTFRLPEHDDGWVSGTSDSETGTLGPATFLARHIDSTPVDISTGAVGPSGLAFSRENNRLYVAGTVSGGAQGKLFKIENALTCTSSCTLQPFATCAAGKCNGPIGINLSKTPLENKNDLLVANGQDGNLVQYDQSGREICTFVGDQTGAGTLFNLLSVPLNDNSDSAQVAYVDDAVNDASFLNPFNI